MTTETQTDRVGALAQLLLSQKHFAGLVLIEPEALAIAKFIDGVLNDSNNSLDAANRRIAELQDGLMNAGKHQGLLDDRIAELTLRAEAAELQRRMFVSSGVEEND